jgi:hypothetical protein
MTNGSPVKRTERIGGSKIRGKIENDIAELDESI